MSVIKLVDSILENAKENDFNINPVFMLISTVAKLDEYEKINKADYSKLNPLDRLDQYEYECIKPWLEIIKKERNDINDDRAAFYEAIQTVLNDKVNTHNNNPSKEGFYKITADLLVKKFIGKIKNDINKISQDIFVDFFFENADVLTTDPLLMFIFFDMLENKIIMLGCKERTKFV